MSPTVLRAATRGSPLALWQTRRVASLLGVDVEEVVVDTTGDRRQDVALHRIGGQGVFAKEVQNAVLDGRADFAVHSAKDLPPAAVDGLELVCVPPRGDPRDALVGGRLHDLPAGAVVATGSVRRRAQLAWRRPDLSFAGLRGNMATRLARAEGGAVVVVAALAALQRLGLDDRASEILEPETMLPQVGQGALAVEARPGGEAAERLAAVEDHDSRRAVDAERAFLAALGGGCDLPVGGHATTGPQSVTLEGLVASSDGRVVLRASASGPDPSAVGAEVARLLYARGAHALLGP